MIQSVASLEIKKTAVCGLGFKDAYPAAAAECLRDPV
jgi:hypothetical protein